MNTPTLIRQKVREVLAMAAKRRFSEEMLFDAVARLVPEKLTIDELKKAIAWNHAQFLIESRFNTDEDRDEWFLTDAGKQKEGL